MFTIGMVIVGVLALAAWVGYEVERARTRRPRVRPAPATPATPAAAPVVAAPAPAAAPAAGGPDLPAILETGLTALAMAGIAAVSISLMYATWRWLGVPRSSGLPLVGLIACAGLCSMVAGHRMTRGNQPSWGAAILCPIMFPLLALLVGLYEVHLGTGARRVARNAPTPPSAAAPAGVPPGGAVAGGAASPAAPRAKEEEPPKAPPIRVTEVTPGRWKVTLAGPADRRAVAADVRAGTRGITAQLVGGRVYRVYGYAPVGTVHVAYRSSDARTSQAPVRDLPAQMNSLCVGGAKLFPDPGKKTVIALWWEGEKLSKPIELVIEETGDDWQRSLAVVRREEGDVID